MYQKILVGVLLSLANSALSFPMSSNTELATMGKTNVHTRDDTDSYNWAAQVTGEITNCYSCPHPTCPVSSEEYYYKGQIIGIACSWVTKVGKKEKLFYRVNDPYNNHPVDCYINGDTVKYTEDLRTWDRQDQRCPRNPTWFPGV